MRVTFSPKPRGEVAAFLRCGLGVVAVLLAQFDHQPGPYPEQDKDDSRQHGRWHPPAREFAPNGSNDT
jgi:hypothetical protein